MPDICLKQTPPWLDWGFSLALTVCELRAIFLFHRHYVYKFECVPVIIHWIHLRNEASM